MPGCLPDHDFGYTPQNASEEFRAQNFHAAAGKTWNIVLRKTIPRGEQSPNGARYRNPYNNH